MNVSSVLEDFCVEPSFSLSKKNQKKGVCKSADRAIGGHVVRRLCLLSIQKVGRVCLCGGEQLCVMGSRRVILYFAIINVKKTQSSKFPHAVFRFG